MKGANSNIGVPGLVALGVVVSALGLFVIASPVHRMNFVTDDVFYVTLPAKHLAAGAGFPSLDGTNPTNGFHPAIFGIDYLLARAGVEDIYIANMVLGLACMMLTALLYHRYAARLASREVAAWATAALVANPFLLASALSGLESTLFTVAIVIYYGRLYAMVDDWCQGRIQPWPSWLLQGFLGVVAYLCRTEFLFHMLGHAMAFFILLGAGWRAGRRHDCVRCFAPWLLLVVPPTAAFFCYGWFSKTMTGHFTQSSASQKSVIHDLAAGNLSAIDPLRFYADFQHHGLLPLLLMLVPLFYCLRQWRRIRPGLLFMLCSTFFILFSYSLLIPIYQWHYMASYVVMASLALPMFLRDGCPDKGERVPALLPLAILLGSAAMVAWVFFTDRDNFYLFRNLDTVFAVVFAGAWILRPRRGDFQRRQFQALAAAGLTSCITMVWKGNSFRNIHHYRSVLATELRDLLSADSKVGAAAAGIYAKFLDPGHRRVVNLDGAISWPALEAIREDRLHAFIDEQDIDILCEFPPVPGFVQTAHELVQVRETLPAVIVSLNSKYGGGD